MQGIISRSVGRAARLGMFALVLAAGSIISTPAAAQVPQPLPTPNVNLLTSGSVYAIARMADGSVVIGGQFVSVNGALRSNIAKRLPDGSLDPNWHPAIDGFVAALAVDADGNVYAGGDFTHVDGYARRNLVKLSPSGTVVLGWDPSPDGTVRALTLHGTDELFVGGRFTLIDGVAKSNLAKVSQASGTVDTTWHPEPFGQFAMVFALANSQDGMLIVGGNFSSIGVSDHKNIAKIAYMGSGVADSDWAPSPNNAVLDVAVAGDGSVFITGMFTQFGDLNSNGVLRSGVAKLAGSGSGAIIAGWDPFNLEQLRWARTIAVDASDSVYIGGGLTYFGTTGKTRYGIVKSSASGVGSIDTSWNPAPSGDVYAIAIGPSVVIAGGSFDEAGGATHLSFLAIDNNGAPASGMFDVEDHQGSVSAIGKLADGGLIVGGSFVKANGEERRNLLRLNPDGSLDMAWNPSANGQISAIAIGADGSVFVGGYFSEINGNSLVGLAKLSGSASGAPETTWNPGLNNNYVTSLAIDLNDLVYVGGRFQAVSGQSGLRNLVRMPAAGTGQIDTTWQPTPQAEVRALSLDGDGALFVAGDLFTIGGEDRRYLAKLLTNGPTLVDPDWNPNPNGLIFSLAGDGQGSVFVGGNFGMIGGQSRDGLAKLSSTGTGGADPIWAPANLGGARPIGVVPNQGVLFAVTSTYDSGTGLSEYSLNKYSSTGTGAIDPNWHPTVNSFISTLLPDGNNLLVGGFFTQVSGQQRYGLAALPINVPDVIYAGGFDSN